MLRDHRIETSATLSPDARRALYAVDPEAVFLGSPPARRVDFADSPRGRDRRRDRRNVRATKAAWLNS